MGGATQRFATGILVDKTGRDKKKRLMGLNEGIRAVKYTDDDDDYSVEKVWKQIEYKSTSLPSLDAAIVQFPFTNGFVSALTHSYKVRWKGEANGIVRYILHPDWSWKAGKFLCSHPISICYRSYLPFAKSPNKKVKRATFLLWLQPVASHRKCAHITQYVYFCNATQFDTRTWLFLILSMPLLLLPASDSRKRLFTGQTSTGWVPENTSIQEVVWLQCNPKKFKEDVPPTSLHLELEVNVFSSHTNTKVCYSNSYCLMTLAIVACWSSFGGIKIEIWYTLMLNVATFLVFTSRSCDFILEVRQCFIDPVLLI